MQSKYYDVYELFYKIDNQYYFSEAYRNFLVDDVNQYEKLEKFNSKYIQFFIFI